MPNVMHAKIRQLTNILQNKLFFKQFNSKPRKQVTNRTAVKQVKRTLKNKMAILYRERR